MTVYWRDSMARVNQSGLGTADSGGTYSLVRGNQALSIASNEALMTYTSSTVAGVVQAGSTAIGDGEMLCRMSQSGNALDLVGLVPRFIDSNHWYSFALGNASNTFQLIKNVSGTFTTIATASFTTTIGAFYWIKCIVIGTSFFGKCWADGSPEPNNWQIGAAGVTDSSIAGPGTFGLVGAPRSGDNVKFDSLYVIDYLNSEQLSITDSFTGGVTSSPVEPLTASDSQAAASTVLLTDGVSIVDQASAGAGVSFTESLAIGSQPSAIMATSWVEGLSAFSQGGSTGSMSPIESLVLGDSFGSASSLTALDALMALDLFGAALLAQWIEALAIADSFTGISGPPVRSPGTPITWITRDNKGTWLTRDNNILWKTRDNEMTWRTRG